jgi:uncharacterized membrane protein
MENPNGNWNRIGTPQCGLMLGAAGAAIAFMLIFLGFFKTLLVCLLFGQVLWLARRENGLVKKTSTPLSP